MMLMDEPLSFLDRARKNEIIHYIRQIPSRFGLEILYVTHLEDELKALADAVVWLSSGRGHLTSSKTAD
jgi:molybdate transport system ATP-binding protein